MATEWPAPAFFEIGYSEPVGTDVHFFQVVRNGVAVGSGSITNDSLEPFRAAVAPPPGVGVGGSIQEAYDKAVRERDSLARRCAQRYEETVKLREQVEYAEMARDQALAHLDRALKVVQAAQEYCDLDKLAVGGEFEALCAAVDAFGGPHTGGAPEVKD